MKRIIFASTVAIFLSSVFATEKVVDLKCTDVFKVSPVQSIELKGTLGEALDTSLSGVKTKDVDMLVYPFKTRTERNTWKSEFWGKWFTSAAWAYDYKPSDDFDKLLKRATSELIKTQDKQGAIKTVCPEFEFRLMSDVNDFRDMTWDVWGRKYVLLGLLAEYERTGDAKVLDAAKKHTDYIMLKIGEGKKDICMVGMWFGVASSSILEPIALLYQYTGEKRYLDFANYIIDAQHKSPRGKDFFRKMLDGWVITDVFHKAGDKNYPSYPGGGAKAYETMSCFEGLLEMYRITGNKDYLIASEKLATSVRDTEIVITGSSSISEQWKCSKHRQHCDTENWQETCVTATWIKLCAQLLRLTGNPIYASDIELAAFNAMIAPQKSDGTWWCHNSPINGTRKAARAQCKRGPLIWHDQSPVIPNEPEFTMNCCVASGPRGLFMLPKVAFMTCDGGAVINLYENSKAVLPVNGEKVSFDISNLQWGKRDCADIKISIAKPMNFALKLYIPQWSENSKVYVNGKLYAGKKHIAKSFNSKKIVSKVKNFIKLQSGKYFEIDRNWKNGDVVKIDFDAKVKVLSIPSQKDILYLKYGPFVLSMDKRFEPKFDQPADVADKNGVVENAKFVKIDGVQLAFDIPLKDGTTRRFVNYSDAGKTWSEASTFATMFKRDVKIKYVPVYPKK